MTTSNLHTELLRVVREAKELCERAPTFVAPEHAFIYVRRARTLLPAILDVIEKQVEEHRRVSDALPLCRGCVDAGNHNRIYDCPVLKAWAKVFGLATMEEK